MRLLALFAAALGAAPLAAQATFNGTIEPATLPSFCQEETHVLTCSGPFPGTGVRLKSSTLDLDAFVGTNARFTAVLRGVECDIWDVTDVQVPPTATLEWCGSPVPGCPVRFRVGPTGVLGQFWLFWSNDTGFLPLDPTLGTLLLAPPVRLLGLGPTAGEGSAVDLVIPSEVSFVGRTFFLQGARRDVGPIGPIELTNVVCLTVLGPSPPCVSPDC